MATNFGPTIFGHEQQGLESLFYGYGYLPIIVEGRHLYRPMRKAMERACPEIKSIQKKQELSVRSFLRDITTSVTNDSASTIASKIVQQFNNAQLVQALDILQKMQVTILWFLHRIIQHQQ